ncbi:MAG: hypothetical protein COA79_17405 [Planctomycetota bacterium]|nr:MAG: hypothetical protein COA79_17405 [Planctomycetota bacterium]
MEKRAKKSPAYEVVLKRLQENISRGIYPFGELLEPERELASHMDVNRQTLRKALSQLVTLNMLAHEPKIGHRVVYEKLKPATVSKDKIALIYYRPTNLLQMDFYYGGVYSEIALQLDQQLGWLIQLISATKPIDEIREIIKSENIKGLITLGVMKPELMVEFNKFGIPLVSFDFDAVEFGIDSVVTDDYEGARQATNLLIHMGHTNIGYMGHVRGGGIVGPDEEFSSTLRHQGYLASLKEAGISKSFSSLTNASVESGVKAFHQLKSECPDLTALVAFVDEMAVGAIRAAESCGLKVPEDFSVIGFGDNPYIKTISNIGLSTVRSEKLSELAKASLVLLFQRMKNSSKPVMKETMAVELIVRESTAQCP